MRAHAQCVNAGIGAAGGVNRGLLAGHRRDGALDRGLHARPVRLALPAHERAAVIFDRQRETGQSRVPAGIAKPRSNSSALMMPRPARWTMIGWIAPVPQ